jgi:multicomponent Na+:H+ antiporter subunit F
MTEAALSLLAVAGACFMVRLVRGPSLADRVVALDGLVVTIVAAIVLDAAARRTVLFVDVAVVVAFVGFVGTAAAARFIEQRGT